ncbi:MAG: glycerol-3-phosphate 1-O-acyltransferase PlsY [Gammaproteobacteria bacterium]|nr:glycerol-3-phosphate 1-O-acyltransferase PlsY [Gammaproteobacteria bacterium]
MLLNTIIILSAYLIGSISSAIIVCKIMGLPDPRTTGSKNPGATNVLRSGNKKAAAITLIGDALKGLIPVLVAKFLGLSPEILAATAVAAFMGHLYPIFFAFKGGKGVATALGVYLGISFPIGLLLAGTWLLIARLSKISSLSALVTAILTPVYIAIFLEPVVYVYMAVFLSVVLIYRHRSNIKDLISGKADKITEKN